MMDRGDQDRLGLRQNAARVLGIARSLFTYYGNPLSAGRLRRFYTPFVPSGSVCFDIGAHTGNRVRCWRSLGARVVAVEPQLDFVKVLRALYGRDAGVTIVSKAVGAKAGAATLYVSPRTPTVTTLSAAWIEDVRHDPSFRNVTWRPGDTVPVTTLEALIAAHGLPAFVKLDVEGYEAEVLKGVARPLPCLSFEYLPAARRRALDCLERLEELGRYRYNWSQGESHRLASPHWRDSAGIRRFLETLPARAGSGDIYARLVRKT